MKKYWFCIIGPVNDKEIKDGCDNAPRNAAQAAIEGLGYKVENNWSGWGVTEEEKNKILKLSYGGVEVDKTIKCNNCKFYKLLASSEGFGCCHRYPPQLDSSGDKVDFQFAEVHEDQWCGEWKENYEL